jgi:hypothetical protein
MSNNSTAALNDAIAAARSGRREDSIRLLRQVVADDPFNVDAWVWLGGVTTDAHEQRAALEHALAVAPDNQRAQQGLDWLRQTRPDVFAKPTSHPAQTRPNVEQPTSLRTGAMEGATQPMPAVYQVPSARTAAPHAALTEPMASVTHAHTEPPLSPLPTQTKPMPTINTSTSSAPLWTGASQTDRMPVAAPAPATTSEAVAPRARGANFARWMVLLLYLVGFGASAVLAAAVLVDPVGFQTVGNAQLAAFGQQLDPALLETTRLTTAGVLVALAVLELGLALGFAFRGRWAWIVNLLVALAITAGAVALAVAAYLFVPLTPGIGTLLSSPLMQPVLGLIAFTLVFLGLSIASRRAFFRRRIERSYGG